MIKVLYVLGVKCSKTVHDVKGIFQVRLVDTIDCDWGVEQDGAQIVQKAPQGGLFKPAGGLCHL